MNFSQFSSPFGGALAANQFAAAKFPPNLATANGQVLGLVSGGDGSMQFLRPMDGNAMAAATAFHQQHQHQQQAAAAAAAANMQQVGPAYITLPITMPGAKPGDAQQTVQIQVLNPNPIPPPAQQMAPKFQMGQMQIPIQGFQQGTTVLTVAYGPQEEELMHNHALPEGMTIVAALQPQDLQLITQNSSLLQQHQQQQQQQSHQQIQNQEVHSAIKIEEDLPPPIRQIKQEVDWNNIPGLTAAPAALGADIAEFLQQRGQSLNLQPFLKFTNNNNNNNNSSNGMV